MPGAAVHRESNTMRRAKPIETLILTIRGEKVILDADLAALYEVPTKSLNQAVKRNKARFPRDFYFQLTTKEWASLRSQIVTSRSETAENEEDTPNRSRSETGSHGGRRRLPYAFTEHGALQAANVLKSE